MSAREVTRDWHSKAYSAWGASLGRSSSRVNPAGHKLRLERVRLDSGGYDRGGAYWGTGEPLWCAWNDEVTYYRRAQSRDAAKMLFVGARFYR